MCDVKNAVVLVIDDNTDNLFLIELLLVSDGYQVETACCGKEGVKKVHQLVPDLIILDMMMPDMTGLEVIDSIKSHHYLSQIPILICTANIYVNDDNVIGVQGVCHKPFEIDDILTRVHSLIACCDGKTHSLDNQTNTPTLVLDVDDSDPLYHEHQQLISNLNNEHPTLEALQKEGYKIVER